MTAHQKFRAYAQRTDFNRRIELLMAFEREDGGYDHAQPVTFKRGEPGDSAPSTLTLLREQGQTLMDALWDAGLRPTEGSGSAGALAATQKHLDDMRRIAFGQLERSPAPDYPGMPFNIPSVIS